MEKLHKAMQVTKWVAVIKGTHLKNSPCRVDEWAKRATPDRVIMVPMAAVPEEQANKTKTKIKIILDLEQCQHLAPRAEECLWMENGGRLREDHIWRGRGTQ